MPGLLYTWFARRIELHSPPLLIQHMITLSSDQNQVSYIGLFSRPVFALWKDRMDLTEQAYEIFSPYETTLLDMRFESFGRSPGEEAFVITLRDLGSITLRFDRLEWTLEDFNDEDLALAPEMLQRLDNSLRSSVEGLEFKNHVFIYFSHSKLSEGTARDYLLSFPNRELPGIEQNLGSGIIYNWVDAEIGGRVQLLIDHSNVVADGLLLQFSILMNNNDIDFRSVIEKARNRLEYALRIIGLEIEQEVE